MRIHLFDADTGQPVGHISESQLRFLKNHLEAESITDHDYYVNAATLGLLAQSGADATLLDVLRTALGNRAEMEVRWATHD